MDFSALNELDGLQFIPVNEKKRPLVKDWQDTITKHNLSNCYGVGLVCGKPSGNVEALDFDLKYDLSGNLFERYKQLINVYEKGLLNKLVVQKTKNGGFHIIYRCKRIEGNLKLANRSTTDTERQKTYDDTYVSESLKGKDDAEAKKVAKKTADNDKVRVLIETRGLGGQIVISPTDGYQMVFGDIQSISEISESERDTLVGVARQFNEYLEEVVTHTVKEVPKTAGLSPFEDFDNRGDVVALLEKNGWKIVKQKGQKTYQYMQLPPPKAKPFKSWIA